METLKYSLMQQHLYDRYLDTGLHKVWVAEDTATFPVWNLSGQLCGYQQYRPGASKKINNNHKDGRYFTRLGHYKSSVWGLESWRLSNTLFVCEGVFDACKVTWLGYSAVAVFSNFCGDSVRAWLSVVRHSRPVVALCDSDNIGLQLATLAHNYYQCRDYHDIGEMPIREVRDVCKYYNYNAKC